MQEIFDAMRQDVDNLIVQFAELKEKLEAKEKQVERIKHAQ